MFMLIVFPVFILAILAAYYHDYRKNKADYHSREQSNIYLLAMGLVVAVILFLISLTVAFLLS